MFFWYYLAFLMIQHVGNLISDSSAFSKSSLNIWKFMLHVLLKPGLEYFEKAEEPEIKLSTSNGSSKKQESSRKTSISALLTMPKPLTVWITINCGKF